MSEQSGPLAVLRAAAARLDDPAGPDPAGPDPAGPDPAGPDLTAVDAPAFDPAGEADRFEAVHDALVAVLAEIERATEPSGAGPQPGVPPGRT